MPSRVWRNKSSSFDENTVSVKRVLAAPVPFLYCCSSACVVEVDTHPLLSQLPPGWGERSCPCSSGNLTLGSELSQQRSEVISSMG